MSQIKPAEDCGHTSAGFFHSLIIQRPGQDIFIFEYIAQQGVVSGKTEFPAEIGPVMFHGAYLIVLKAGLHQTVQKVTLVR